MDHVLTRRTVTPSAAPLIVVASLLAAVLSGCGSGATTAGLRGGGPVEVAVTPPIATVPTKGQQAFAAAVSGPADTSVTWGIAEANCGQVNSGGIYTAPSSTATCTVVATSNADTTKSASSLVTVQDPGTYTVWEPLKVGAGGWISGIDACKAGTTYAIRTDTYGGYLGSPGSVWQQAVRADTMPAAFVATMGDWQNEGIYEIRVAPSDCNRLYMSYKKKLYKSSNRGVTWAETAFSYSGTMNAADGYRFWGEKMAVDPANPDVVYLGTVSSGLLVTADGGATWKTAADIPVPTHAAGITGIVFDETSGTTGGRTNVIYATSNGSGVYRSSNAGASWSLLSGGPTTTTHAAVASDGVYYAANLGTSMYRYGYQGGAWFSSPSASQSLHTVAPDPNDPAHIIAASDGGRLIVSADHGTTWVGGIPIWDQYTHRVATDVPWLAFAKETYMSSGRMMFDPAVANRLWFTEGIGVWYSTGPWAPNTDFNWNSQCAGIEQLVGRDVIVPPGGPNVITAGMDRSIWVLPKANTSYPSRYGIEPTPSASLILAYALTYSAANPAHIAAIINHGIAGEPEMSGYSLDSGATWTKFPVQPGSGGQGGDVAATTIDNIITVIGTRYAYRSTDRGASWTPLTLPGDSGANNSNLHCGYNCNKHILAVDGATPGTVYLYFYLRGLYRSIDSGATWSLVSTNPFDGGNMYWQVKLRAVPGQAGHLFLTAGQAGGAGSANPAATSLWRSTNGGATWTTVAGMAEPYDVALGKPAPGQTYPAIYVVGWYNKVYGIWRSIDNASSWTNLGPFPYNSMDEVNRLAASQDVFGDVYLAFQGSGWAYGRLGSPPP